MTDACNPATDTCMRLHHYQKNMRVLASRCSAAYKWLISHPEAEQEALDYVLFDPDGRHDWRLPSGLGVMASMPPGDIYSDWLDKPPTGADMTIVVGSNLGYGMLRFLDAAPPDHKLTVLEPDPAMMAGCLGLSDLRERLQSGRLFFLPPNELYIERFVRRLDVYFTHGRIALRIDPASRKLGPAYELWRGRLQQKLDSFRVDMQTLRLQQDCMVENELANLAKAHDDGSLAALHKAAEGLPAVAFGAGPSLAATAEAFRNEEGKRLLCCGLQTLPALQQLGITPHFCLAIDFRHHMLLCLDKLDHEQARNVPLIYSTKVQPELVRRYPGLTLPLWTMGGLASLIPTASEPVLDVGSNVGLALLRFLEWAGIHKVLLVGQDFGFADEPGSVTHVEGHYASGPAQQGDAYSMQVKLPEGRCVRTSPQLLAARNDLDSWLRRSSMSAFTVYGGGLPIDEARAIASEEARDWSAGNAAKKLSFFVEKLSALPDTPSETWLQNVSPDLVEFSGHTLRTVEQELQQMNLQRYQDILNALRKRIEADPVSRPYLYNECIELAGLTLPRRTVNQNALHLVQRIADKLLHLSTTISYYIQKAS